MSISQHLISLRREHNLTRQEMADGVGLHMNQIRRYESEYAQPSLEALKKIAVGLSISLDTLVFENDERNVAREILDSPILKHAANRFSTGARQQEAAGAGN